jgi:hypothetical protein
MSFIVSLFLGAYHLPIGEPFAFSHACNFIGYAFRSVERSVLSLDSIFWQKMTTGMTETMSFL